MGGQLMLKAIIFTNDNNVTRSARAQAPVTRRAVAIGRPVRSRGSLVIRAAGTVSTNDLKNGLTVEIDGVPYKVTGAGREARRSVLRSRPPMHQARAVVWRAGSSRAKTRHNKAQRADAHTAAPTRSPRRLLPAPRAAALQSP